MEARTTVTKKFGLIAKQNGFELELQVLNSQSGFYIGTATEEGFPVSRESAEYFSDHDAAALALTENRWTQRADA
ncbi:hypothetical protein KW811_22135 [Enterobacter quasiroggenkampii]|uniref:hypothetical protein n=1 Tax=Enterobacter quasiroggenkampii TaxID=2497436 RepID=UPI0021D1304D|nr:hypothetical protein [Enterobacter quasiroggenkampii]MCU6401187.1 hypothetical protein [Enterobacter quasiroggenkampii]